MKLNLDFLQKNKNKKSKEPAKILQLKDFFLDFVSRKQQEIQKLYRQRLILLLTIFFIVVIFLLLIITPVLAYQYWYQGKIYSGISIDGVNVSGLTSDQAISELNRYIDNLNDRGINFVYKGDNLNIGLSVISPTDPDLAFSIVNFDVEFLVQHAYAYGRQQSFWANLVAQAQSLLTKTEIPLTYTINQEELTKILREKYSAKESPAHNAEIIFSDNNQYIIGNDQSGFEIDYQQAVDDLQQQINLISLNTINLQTVSSAPQVTKAEAEQVKPLIDQFLLKEKIILHYEDKSWEINKDELKNWLTFTKDQSVVLLSFKPESVEQKLQAIGQEINVAPQDAKFNIVEGKVTEFQPAMPGLEVDLAQSSQKINEDIIKNNKTEVILVVKESAPQIKTAESNNLGIKELLGKGVSDFSGSHTNRIKNIQNAVAHLNGIIIPPGEFSTVDAIGEVTAATGYFQEYVIKGNRTIPEYGGGLCQIGTTMFRAALYSGLPVTERRPHSYIVTYYNPLGMDATIYGPHPDLRFDNDTGSNILLQIKIEGTKLTFEFWGSSDGRKVEITDPQLYNWTGQPADKLIENPKLKPGDKKLMEKGRRGADSHFYRYITVANGEKKEEIWRSHYVAWPNIYEVGIAETPAEQPAATTDETSSPDSTAGSSGSSVNINSNTNSN